jgi:hypothetical protein
MILHQAIRVNLPAGLLATFRKGFDPASAGLAINVVQKDSFAAVPAAHDMVNGSRILNSHLAWHGQLRAAPPTVSTRKTEPCYGCDPFSKKVPSNSWRNFVPTPIRNGHSWRRLRNGLVFARI